MTRGVHPDLDETCVAPDGSYRHFAQQCLEWDSTYRKGGRTYDRDQEQLFSDARAGNAEALRVLEEFNVFRITQRLKA